MSDRFEATPRVLVLASAIHDGWGGEAVLPIHVFKGLRQRGIEAWISSRDIYRNDLQRILGTDFDRWIPVPNGLFERTLTWLWHRNPPFFPREILTFPASFMTQYRQRKVVQQAVRHLGVNVAHQVIPVAPRLPTGLRVDEIPFVIGPLNGGMDYPPGFRSDRTNRDTRIRNALRSCSRLVHSVFPNARAASCVLVANARTQSVLPYTPRMLVVAAENGIDADRWADPPQQVIREPGEPVRFVFAGVLQHLKGVQWAIDALARVRSTARVHLDIVGRDHGMRPELERRVAALGLRESVTFHGFQPQPQAFEILRRGDVFVLPSIKECGGAVILEAMAAGKPVISVNWGGPADYVTPETGFLVDPQSPLAMVDGIATAMLRLAGDPDLRARMGSEGRKRVMERFTWQAKIDAFCELYASLLRAKDGVPEPLQHPLFQAATASAAAEAGTASGAKGSR